MHLAFCLFKYFPYGGLQRDFLRIAKACLARGHTVHVFTMSWEGERPQEMAITLIPPVGRTNHQCATMFAKQVAHYLKMHDFDGVIGFNRMPGLDVYYAADLCYEALVRADRPFWYRWTPRYRHYAALERAVFAPSAKTHALLLTASEKAQFSRYYQTPVERFHLLPPGIDASRLTPYHASGASAMRERIRAELSMEPGQKLLLMVGSGFTSKGVDRALQALASLQDNSQLIILGNGNAKPFKSLSTSLGVDSRVRFLGGRDDVGRFMLAADLLIHPAYRETAGMVLLEAIVAGLPILVTANCGYAFHVEEAKAGLLVSTPFCQQELNDKLRQMLYTTEAHVWRQQAVDYAAKTDLYSLPERAAKMIEQVVSSPVRNEYVAL